jgi:glycerate kinase
MKIILAPGAYKSSLSAVQVAEALARGLRRSGLRAELIALPIADGGDGTLDAFLAAGGETRTVPVLDPLDRPITARYALLPDGETAVIEMAEASGLRLLSHEELNPLRASTYGTGQLLQAAVDAGARRLIIGLGGSATVDGGAGCLQALGVKLLDSTGAEVARGGGQLGTIRTIDTTGLDPRWKQTVVTIASDVNNPPLGPEGAAAVFGPQKGASPEMIAHLETSLAHFFTLVHDHLGVDVRAVPGGGAAGAFAAGLMAFLGGRIASGIDLVLEHNGFAGALVGADLVITGEGQMDEQTVYGKGPIGVARLARSHGVPTVAVVGGLNVDDAVLRAAGIDAALPIVVRPMPLEEALARADELVERAAFRLGGLLQIKP